ncbi:hypothetical protein T10_4042 [Trichinella papuae]|uniref:MULE transposase domain-containing protein n=1 Tax=Trichinella papuae TaxID=268474 RepID=A0A0V1MML2_9BILA|nr:hypothetical protein T10_4042 [Trichinella papuae]
MGRASYYWQLVRNIADVVNPLHTLTKKGKNWHGVEKEEKAFNLLKRALVSPLIPAHPDFDRPLLLDVDANLPTYIRIIDVLHSKAEELGFQLDLAKFVCDFETALIPAIQGNFPNTRVQGCFFHFCQGVLWQVGRLGLRTDYINNQEIRKKVKMLMSLAFLLMNIVPAGFEILNVGTSGQVEALFEYFQREWLPATKILLWNVHAVAVQTNNYLEFLRLIIDEQGKTETVVRQMDDGYTWGSGSVRHCSLRSLTATGSCAYE